MELQFLGNANQSALQALGEVVDDIDLISGLGADSQHEILLREMRAAEEMDGLGSKAKRKARREKRRQKRAKKRAEGKPRGIKKFLFAPARNAFLLALKVNFLKLATRLAKAWNAGHSEKIKSKWLKFGGKPAALKKEIARGAKINLNGLGAEPVTTGGAFVLALPIIIAMVVLLKKLGIIKPGKDDEEVDDKLEDIKDIAEGEGYDLGEDGKGDGEGDGGGGGFLSTAGMPLLIGAGALLLLMGGGKKRK